MFYTRRGWVIFIALPSLSNQESKNYFLPLVDIPLTLNSDELTSINCAAKKIASKIAFQPKYFLNF